MLSNDIVFEDNWVVNVGFLFLFVFCRIVEVWGRDRRGFE